MWILGHFDNDYFDSIQPTLCNSVCNSTQSAGSSQKDEDNSPPNRVWPSFGFLLMLISDQMFHTQHTQPQCCISREKGSPTRKSSLGSKVTLRTGASWPRSVFCWLLSDTSTTLTMKSLRKTDEIEDKYVHHGMCGQSVFARDWIERKSTSAVNKHECKLSNQWAGKAK